MGNRAVISASTAENAPAVYLHWNGGRASVEGFIRACRSIKPNADMELFHRIAQSFIGSSAYLETVGTSDRNNWDHGWFILNDDWEIVERRHRQVTEEFNPAKTEAIAVECIAAWHYWPN